ncbi:hypothetical protein BDK51DRAFT_51613 [Blyttiomyces helicus]|uniref:K Homology domain-containing protein n=1 Tax=Blyttiomyces helicus TaxID=388810 RepID=A0A4P9W6G0_9FUNG|nr:hypothetical protein BDK51DRAFT_51613 [Blyttiomyces helicus]|eukprot:RKO86518.1 hypothetical protein BDK51DRAFT_51613 [Blyttiomyces helicus]
MGRHPLLYSVRLAVDHASACRGTLISSISGRCAETRHGQKGSGRPDRGRRNGKEAGTSNEREGLTLSPSCSGGIIGKGGADVQRLTRIEGIKNDNVTPYGAIVHAKRAHSSPMFSPLLRGRTLFLFGSGAASEARSCLRFTVSPSANLQPGSWLRLPSLTDERLAMVKRSVCLRLRRLGGRRRGSFQAPPRPTSTASGPLPNLLEKEVPPVHSFAHFGRSAQEDLRWDGITGKNGPFLGRLSGAGARTFMEIDRPKTRLGDFPPLQIRPLDTRLSPDDEFISHCGSLHGVYFDSIAWKVQGVLRGAHGVRAGCSERLACHRRSPTYMKITIPASPLLRFITSPTNTMNFNSLILVASAALLCLLIPSAAAGSGGNGGNNNNDGGRDGGGGMYLLLLVSQCVVSGHSRSQN